MILYIQGRAIFGSGSPFDPVKYNDKLFVPAQVWNIDLCINEVPKFLSFDRLSCDLYIELYQANNAYIFPGFGLGVVISGAVRVTDDMVLAAGKHNLL